jgi:hypothetical protein
MQIPLSSKQLAAEALERGYPELFANLNKEDMVKVAQYWNLHPELDEMCEDIRTIALVLSGIIVLLIDRQVLKSCLSSGWTVEAQSDIARMRSKAATIIPVAPVAEAAVPVVPVVPVRTPAQLEEDADNALIAEYRMGSTSELKRKLHQDPKLMARFNRLSAAGRMNL